MTRSLRSFLEIEPDSHFSIYNLPYGVFRPRAGGPARVGVAIGKWVLDTAVLAEAGLFTGPHLQGQGQDVFAHSSLNAFMRLGRPAWLEARATLQELLSADCPTLRDNDVLREQALHSMDQVEMLLPAAIGDYTDFYSSIEHASNVGRMFRGAENALLPNWRHLPVAYHGRASSVVVSGTAVHRPQGQILPEQGGTPEFAPTAELDFEMEVGFFVGPGNELGQPIPAADAEDHIFGLVLVNDWSARDIQRWEYRPLGPFLAKNFATSISPWVVTLEALQPFRCPAVVQDPPPLAYLQDGRTQTYDIQLEVTIQSSTMSAPNCVTRTNFRHLYWRMPQQLAHHTITGCNVQPGDLLASGTISGPTSDSYGSLLELTWRGERPISLTETETRRFLQDGDTVTMTGWCQGDGYRVGFGAVTGTILPAKSLPR